MAASDLDNVPVAGGVEALAEKPKLKKPPLYNVVLINDDYTPMEFVVEVLQLFFALPQPKAVQIMLQIHTQGKGICGTYAHDIAETKAQQTNSYSRQHNHPLLCTLELT